MAAAVVVGGGALLGVGAQELLFVVVTRGAAGEGRVEILEKDDAPGRYAAHQACQGAIADPARAQRHDVDVQLQESSQGVDQAALPGSRYSVQQVPSPERDAPIHVPPLRKQEVLGVVDQHLFHTRVQDDAVQRTLCPRIGPPPTSVGIGEVDLDPVNALGFIFLLRLQDELLEDVVGAGDDGDGDGFAARVEFALALDAEPVPAEEDGVGGVVSGLEDDTGAGFLD